MGSRSRDHFLGGRPVQEEVSNRCPKSNGESGPRSGGVIGSCRCRGPGTRNLRARRDLSGNAAGHLLASLADQPTKSRISMTLSMPSRSRRSAGKQG
jgi:hypothetical protein